MLICEHVIQVDFTLDELSIKIESSYASRYSLNSIEASLTERGGAEKSRPGSGP